MRKARKGKEQQSVEQQQLEQLQNIAENMRGTVTNTAMIVRKLPGEPPESQG